MIQQSGGGTKNLPIYNLGKLSGYPCAGSGQNNVSTNTGIGNDLKIEPADSFYSQTGGGTKNLPIYNLGKLSGYPCAGSGQNNVSTNTGIGNDLKIEPADSFYSQTGGAQVRSDACGDGNELFCTCQPAAAEAEVGVHNEDAFIDSDEDHYAAEEVVDSDEEDEEEMVEAVAAAAEEEEVMGDDDDDDVGFQLPPTQAQIWRGSSYQTSWVAKRTMMMTTMTAANMMMAMIMMTSREGGGCQRWRMSRVT